MKPILLALVSFTFFNAYAGRISGTVTDDKGNRLPFASISIKGTTRGTTANNEGRYFITLDTGQFTIVCQYVGYERQEKTVEISNADVEVIFQLSLLELSMEAVVVKPGGGGSGIRHHTERNQETRISFEPAG